MLYEIMGNESPWHVDIVNTIFVIAFYSFANCEWNRLFNYMSSIAPSDH
jgi:hypothetical protein